jgi:glycosyltransferase involved in cell wall biosynthesis
VTTKTQAVSVVVPAFNEEAMIGETIAQLKETLTQAAIEHEIIIVDDGSADRTAEIARQQDVHVIQRESNHGYGAALKLGIQRAAHEVIVITDADGTYPIDRIPDLLAEMQNADMVVGARVGKNVHIPLVRRPAKRILHCLAEYVTGSRLADLNSGLRVFRRPLALQYYSILSDKFSFTTTITVAALCGNYRVHYIPIDYYKREGKSKIVPWDFVTFISLVLRLSMLFNPLKVFVPLAMLSLGMALVKFIADVAVVIHSAGSFSFLLFFTNKIISSSTLMLGVSGLQILLIGMMADGIVRRIAFRHLPMDAVRDAADNSPDVSESTESDA